MSEHVSAQARWTRRPEGSNWGDFGPEDQVGRMNLITAEKRLEAAREIRDGRVFVLSLPLDFPGGDTEESSRRAPRLHSNAFQGHSLCNLPMSAKEICCDDRVLMSLQYSTQWDALVHWGRRFDVDGSGNPQPVYYNGFRAGTDYKCCDEKSGPYAYRLGIEKMAETGVQGRGVLINLVKAFGTRRQVIDYDMLMHAIEVQRVEVREADMLLLYTGYGDALIAMNRQPDTSILARTGAVLKGSDKRLQHWMEKSGIAALISDNEAVEGFDLSQQPDETEFLFPLHDCCLFRLGIHLGEMWWLKDLAEYLDQGVRHAFMLTAPPLRLPGAAGSPATPVATV